MLKTIIKFLIKLYCTITFWVMWPVLWNKSIIFEPKRVDGIPLKSEYNKAIKNNIILSA